MTFAETLDAFSAWLKRHQTKMTMDEAVIRFTHETKHRLSSHKDETKARYRASAAYQAHKDTPRTVRFHDSVADFDYVRQRFGLQELLMRGAVLVALADGDTRWEWARARTVLGRVRAWLGIGGKGSFPATLAAHCKRLDEAQNDRPAQASLLPPFTIPATPSKSGDSADIRFEQGTIDGVRRHDGHWLATIDGRDHRVAEADARAVGRMLGQAVTFSTMAGDFESA